MGKWTTLCDVDGTFKEYRRIGRERKRNRRFLVIDVLDMYEWVGPKDIAKSERYCGTLSFIFIDAISTEVIEQAKRCVGLDAHDGEITDEMLVEALHSYGCKAPLASASFGGEKKCRRAMRRGAMEAIKDLEACLDRPVNALGSTAWEYMLGDITSAALRGCESGEPKARLVAKMYGVDQMAVDDARPADWLPFLAGYAAGVEGREAMKNDPANTLAPEYLRGFERGKRVRAGECPAPGWIKLHNAKRPNYGA